MKQEMLENGNRVFKKTYIKVTPEKSLKLIYIVFKLNKNIKTAARLAQINYAAAKSIIRKFRKNYILKVPQKLPENKRCSFKVLKNSQINMRIISLSGGQPQSQQVL